MNSHHEFDDSPQLDRLVDGELAGDEYRALLATLDKEPDGWRRCALAFLEAQSWQQELRQLSRDTMSRDTILERDRASSQLVDRDDRHWSTRQVAGLLLAMAMSFAIALAGGAWWQLGGSSQSEPDLTTMARQNSTPLSKGIEEVPIRSRDREPKPEGVPAEHLTIVVDRGDGQSDQFELPIYAANDSVARQLLQGLPPIPVEVERAIRDSGFQLQRQRQWTRVRLRDGRRAYFPVDQLEITPVSGNTYY